MFYDLHDLKNIYNKWPVFAKKNTYIYNTKQF